MRDPAFAASQREHLYDPHEAWSLSCELKTRVEAARSILKAAGWKLLAFGACVAGLA